VRRVPPSTVIREEIDRLLSHGASREANLLSELAELGLRYLVQQGVEQEQQDFLGRAHYERRGDGEAQRGYRNGYEDARLKTAEGAVPVKVPQVREAESPYRSRLMEFLDGNSDVLERLVVEMYARGLSTRDVEDCFPNGCQEAIAPSVVSVRVESHAGATSVDSFLRRLGPCFN
jgi:putative transposase